MESISPQMPPEFTPDAVQTAVLLSVAEKQGCPVRHVVQHLLPFHSERTIRSSIHVMLDKAYLDGGKPTSDTTLRLTSRGRILLQQAGL